MAPPTVPDTAIANGLLRWRRGSYTAKSPNSETANATPLAKAKAGEIFDLCKRTFAAFIHDMEHDPFSRGLVTTVLELARAMGAEAVAEGVEGAEQARALAALGCRLAQGYYFSVPLPEVAFRELMARDVVLPLRPPPT